MLNCIFVGVGGFIGSVCRYLVGLIPWQMDSGFPIKTLLINVVGAFFISLITAFGARSAVLSPRIALMLRVGVCGGFTTFSTFAYEAADLMQSGRSGVALAYLVLSAVLGMAAVFAAQLLVQ